MDSASLSSLRPTLRSFYSSISAAPVPSQIPVCTTQVRLRLGNPSILLSHLADRTTPRTDLGRSVGFNLPSQSVIPQDPVGASTAENRKPWERVQDDIQLGNVAQDDNAGNFRLLDIARA